MKAILFVVCLTMSVEAEAPRFVYPTSLTSLKRAISHQRPFYVPDRAKGSPAASWIPADDNSTAISITSIGQSVNKYPQDRIRKVYIRKNPSDPADTESPESDPIETTPLLLGLLKGRKPSGDPDASDDPVPMAPRIIEAAPFMTVQISSSEEKYGALGSEYSRMVDPIDPFLPSTNRYTSHPPEAADASSISDPASLNRPDEDYPPAVAYEAPSYGAPVYQAPVYEGPEYTGPVFEAPSNGSTTIILVLNNDFTNLKSSKDLQVGPFFFHFVRGNSGKIGFASPAPPADPHPH